MHGSPTQRTGLAEGISKALSHSTLPSLDGLRAIAVFLVVFYHYGIPGVNGGLGVLMFFVISGFLITWLLLKEEGRWGSISLKLFYLRRTLRIFPAFYFYWLLIVVGLGVILGKRIVWPQAVSSFVYVSNYYQALFGDPGTGLSHTWSLAVEEQFYLLWPLTFIALRDNTRRIKALAMMILFVWLYRMILVTVVHVNSGYIYEALDTRADHLLIGCLLATLLYEGRAAKIWKALTASTHLIWITLGLLAVSSVAPSVLGVTYRNLVGFILDPLLTAALIVQAMTFYESTAAWMNSTVAGFLGRMSYSIYLYQQIAMHPVKNLLAAYPAWVQFAAAMVCLLTASMFSYYVVERPFLALKERIGKRKPSSTTVSEAPLRATTSA
jgi:peptidoglycan/LPS O-acetylase OafA/YrhL